MNELFDQRTKKIFYILIWTMIAFLLLAIFLGLSRAKTGKEIIATAKSNKVLTQKIADKQEQLNKEASKNALDNSEHEVKISALQVQTEKKIKDTVNKLFPIFLNYSNSKEYEKRKILAKPYLENSVFKSTNIFKSDELGSSGVSYLDELGIVSKFDSVACSIGIIKQNHVPIIVIAGYEAWFKNSTRKGIGQDIYEGMFNIKTGKFDKLDRVNNLYSGRR